MNGNSDWYEDANEPYFYSVPKWTAIQLKDVRTFDKTLHCIAERTMPDGTKQYLSTNNPLNIHQVFTLDDGLVFVMPDQWWDTAEFVGTQDVQKLKEGVYD